VRDPWERLHSWWRHEHLYRTTTFEEYVLHRARLERYPSGARVTRLLIAKQEEWVESPSVGLDFVGHFERLQFDFDRLCDFVGKKRREVPHEHLSIAREAHPYAPDLWTPDMLTAMAPDFEPFAEKYGYEAPS